MSSWRNDDAFVKYLKQLPPECFPVHPKTIDKLYEQWKKERKQK